MNQRNRYLNNKERVYEYNAWDDVEWDEKNEVDARQIVLEQSSVVVSKVDRDAFEQKADEYWNSFYLNHKNKFFKDRRWLQIEFPEIFEKSKNLKNHQPFRVLEAGCGVGNTIFPLLESFKSFNSADVHIFGFDFAESAIELIENHPAFDKEKSTVFVHDLKKPIMRTDVPPESLDFITMIFVASALPEDFHESIFREMSRLLKPGGMILFRDYGRYDMSQLRFKPGRMLRNNHYVRGDGTQVYYFDPVELRHLIEERIGLTIVQHSVDRRLLVNRKRKLEMYRVWIQGKWMKPKTEE